jgi:uncharacterized protein YhaN
MIIHDLVVSGIGRFSQATKFPLKQGYNVILGENESGKTTFSRAFMAVLFPDVYALTQDFVNWQLEGSSRASLTIAEGNTTYRLIRDFTQGLSNLSRYIPEKKAFVLVSKDGGEIEDFLSGTFKLFDEEIFSSLFYTDFKSLPSANPFGVRGALHKSSLTVSTQRETDDEYEGMDPALLKQKLETLKSEMERSKELEDIQAEIDEENAKLFTLQTDIREIRKFEERIFEINQFVEKFKSMGDVQEIRSRIEKYGESQSRKENAIRELRNRKGQAEAGLMNAPVPSLTDNTLLFAGLGVAGVGILITYILSGILTKYIPQNILQLGNFVVLGGFAVAGWGFWQYISALGNISKLKRTIADADEQIKQHQLRFDAEMREIDQLKKAFNIENIDNLKGKVFRLKQAESEKRDLEIKLEELKREKGYDELISEVEAREARIEELSRKLEKLGFLGFTPQEMRDEARKIENYLAKKGIPVQRTEGTDKKTQKMSSFGSGGGTTRFPPDHFARFLAIATELLQKGQIDPLAEIQNAFNTYIQLLSNKHYARATFSKDGVIKFFKADSLMRVGMESISPATKDVMCFALQFALIESILKRRSLPLIFDDPFLLLDDVRLEAVASIIKKLSQKGQAILLTSRQALLKGADHTLRMK